MKGIVDELRLDDLGKIVIVEVKTRRSNSFPSDAQKRNAELQVGNAQLHCYVAKLSISMSPDLNLPGRSSLPWCNGRYLA